jgi:hypothetical protein
MYGTSKERKAVVGRLAHSSVLDISIYEHFIDLNSRLKAICNFSMGLPKPFHIVITAFFFIQILGPCLCIDSLELWPADSTFTAFVRIIGVLWGGPIGNARIPICMTFALIGIVLFFAQIPGWATFSIAKVLSKWHQSLFQATFRYARPIFATIAMAGVPESFHYLVEKDENFAISCWLIAFQVIHLPILYFDLPLITSRLLFENNPKHEWYYKHPLKEMAILHVLVILSGCIGLLGSTLRRVFLAVIAVIYIVFGRHCLLWSPTVKRKASV